MLSLQQPLALVGFMGAGVRRIAHALAARTGLPICDLDRLLEQRAGMSLARLALERGDAARRALEAELLEPALRSRPAGILALGDGALLAARSRALVMERAHLVYVERPLPVLLRLVCAELHRAPINIPEFVLAAPAALDDLLPYFAEREPGYLQAHTILPVRNLHAARVVEAVLFALRGGRHPSSADLRPR